MLSTAKKLILGLSGVGLMPGLAHAQSVVVRHVVQADVVPLASVRDSGWARTSSDSLRWTWTAVLQANTASELQVLGPDDNSTSHVRVGSGPWIRLHARVWNAVSILGAGTRHIVLEYSAVASVASLGPPDVRIR